MLELLRLKASTPRPTLPYSSSPPARTRGEDRNARFVQRVEEQRHLLLELHLRGPPRCRADQRAPRSRAPLRAPLLRSALRRGGSERPLVCFPACLHDRGTRTHPRLARKDAVHHRPSHPPSELYRWLDSMRQTNPLLASQARSIDVGSLAAIGVRLTGAGVSHIATRLIPD